MENQDGKDYLENIFILGDEVEKDKIVVKEFSLEEFLSSFSYLPTEDRLAHQLGSKMSIETQNFQQDNKIWNFDIKINSINNVYVSVDLHYVDDLKIKDIEKYKMIFQLCLNGNLEDREFLDKIGIITERSVWRCSFCGGVFGLTYQDCLEHEKSCSKNPDNIPKEKENDIEDFEDFEDFV